MEMSDSTASFNESITQCYATYARMLSARIYYIIKDEHASEELVHDLFLRILERRIGVDPRLVTTKWYLLRMARNIAYDYLRKKNKRDACFDDIIFEEVCLNERFYRDVESVYIEGEVVSTLHDCIQDLPERNRRLVCLHSLRGKRLGEVVRETGISSYMIKRIEKESMGILRSRMERLLGGWRVAVRRPPVGERNAQ